MNKKEDKSLGAGNKLFRVVFDAVADWAFIVDSDVRIVDFNTQAQQGLGKDGDTLLFAMGGNALNCQHAIESGGACGLTESCKTCEIRIAVRRSLRKGRSVRTTTKMVVLGGDGIIHLDLKLTATPFHYKDVDYVLLMFQNITDPSTQEWIPVCSSCLRVRKDKDSWIPMNTFLATLPGVNISHAICPDCKEELYGHHLRQARKIGRQKAAVIVPKTPVQNITKIP